MGSLLFPLLGEREGPGAQRREGEGASMTGAIQPPGRSEADPPQPRGIADSAR
jgi:hypothetical protein